MNLTCRCVFGVALSAFLAAGALAQDLAGTWQGVLTVGAAKRELRTVIKISKDDNVLKAVLFSIDQGASPGVPSGSVSVRPGAAGSAVTMAFPGIGASYSGTVSADGNSISGNFAQGPAPLPLNLQRASAQTAWDIPAPPPKPKAMAADANLIFAVAAIKLANPDLPGKGITVAPGGRRFSTRNTSLVDLVTFAYGIHPRQITGAPAWFETEKFDITAEPEAEGAPNDRQLRAMLQSLLADRFQFTFHRGSKELSVYTITTTGVAVKLTPSTADPDGLYGIGFRGLGSLVARNANMKDFAGNLQTSVLDRPVVDQTGLSGRYDFTLNWTPDEFQFTSFGVKPPAPPDTGEARPDLFIALRQQLGLKLEGTKTAVEVFIVDKVEKPSAN